MGPARPRLPRSQAVSSSRQVGCVFIARASCLVFAEVSPFASLQRLGGHGDVCGHPTAVPHFRVFERRPCRAYVQIACVVSS